MKRTFFVTALFILTVTGLYSSPQAPELLIIENDTIPIYQIPFDEMDPAVLGVFYNRLEQEEIKFTRLNLWRGVQGIWRIEDDKLYLVGLSGVNDSKGVFQEIFPDHYSDGKVYAYWFSSEIIIPRGEVLRWDGVFGRTYYEEEHLFFREGVLSKRKNVDNYFPVKDGISRRIDPFEDFPNRFVNQAMFESVRTLDWEKLSHCCLCDDEYMVTIGSNGRVKKVVPTDEDSYKRCSRKMKRRLKKLKFDIVKWNGKPFKEEIRLEVFYDDDAEVLLNWTY